MAAIVFPWSAPKWPERRRILETPITNVAVLDNVMSMLSGGRIVPRSVSDLFARYCESEFPEKISEATLLGVLVPFIRGLVLDGPRTFRGVTLTELPSAAGPGAVNVMLRRHQCATILACMWFGLLGCPRKSPAGMADPCVGGLYGANSLFALQCFIGYFRRVHEYVTSDDRAVRTYWGRSVIIVKKTAVADVLPSALDACGAPLCAVMFGEGSVDESPARLRIVSSRPHLGGGVFAQWPNEPQKILGADTMAMWARPESLVVLLLAPNVGPGESVAVLGAEKISHVVGFAQYGGDYSDGAATGSSSGGRQLALLQTADAFADASDRSAAKAQLTTSFYADLTKVCAAMNALPVAGPDAPGAHGGPGTQLTPNTVAIGAWSHLQTQSHPHVKFLQAWLAASMCGKNLLFYAPHEDIECAAATFVDLMRDRTVADLHGAYIDTLRTLLQSGTELATTNLFAGMVEYV